MTREQAKYIQNRVENAHSKKERKLWRLQHDETEEITKDVTEKYKAAFDVLDNEKTTALDTIMLVDAADATQIIKAFEEADLPSVD